MATHSGGARGTIAVLVLGIVIYGLAMGTTYPLLGILLADEVSGFWNGLNASATGLGLLLGVMFLPRYSRWLGPGSAPVAGVTIMALSLLAILLLDDFWLIFLARVCLGLGANLLFVVTETALNALAPPAQRGRVMGIYTAAAALGYVAGPAVIAATLDQGKLVLALCALFTAAAILPLLRARKPVDRAVRPAPLQKSLPAILAFPLPFGLLIVASAVDAVAISLLPVIAVQQSYPIEQATLFVAIFHLGLLTGQPLIGWSLDRLGRRVSVCLCCLLSLAATLLLTLGPVVGFWSAALLMFLWGAANFGLYTAGLALIGDRFSGSALTAATVAFAGVYALAALASPLLAGGMLAWLSAGGFYAVMAALYLMSLLAAYLLLRPAPCRAGQLAG